MPMFPNAQAVSISGGQFNDVSGDQVNYYDNSRTDIRDAFNTHNNAFSDSFNDNSFRGTGPPRSAASSPGIRARDDSPFGPGFPFSNPGKRTPPPSGRPFAPQRETEPAPSGRSRSPFDSTKLHPSLAAKVDRATQRAASAAPSPSGASNVSNSYNTNNKDINGSYNDNSIQTTNYNKFHNHNVTDSHDDNRDYSRNSFDQSYRDNRDQSVRDSYNPSSYRKDDRSTQNNQDYRDQSQRTKNDNRNFDRHDYTDSRTDNRKYDNSDHRKYDSDNDNRKYDNHKNDNRKYDNRDYDNRQFENRIDARVDTRHETRNDNRVYDSHDDNRRSSRSSFINDSSTKNIDNSNVNQNTISGQVSNSGVMNLNSPQRSTNPFINTNKGPAPVTRRSRDEDEESGTKAFASNAHTGKTPRVSTPKPVVRISEERDDDAPLERSKPEASSSSRRSSGDREERIRTPQPDSSSHRTRSSTDELSVNSSMQTPLEDETPEALLTPELVHSPQPHVAQQPLPPVSPKPSASPQPLPQPQDSPSQSPSQSQLPQPEPEQAVRPTRVDSVAGVLDQLFLKEGEEDEAAPEAVRSTSPATKETMRKRDKFRNLLHLKKDKEGKGKGKE